MLCPALALPRFTGARRADRRTFDRARGGPGDACGVRLSSRQPAESTDVSRAPCPACAVDTRARARRRPAAARRPDADSRAATARIVPAPRASPARPPINPAHDQQDLAAQGTQRPDTGEIRPPARTRSSATTGGAAFTRSSSSTATSARARELFHNLALGRHGSVLQGTDPQNLAPHPLDQSYSAVSGAHGQDDQPLRVDTPPRPARTRPSRARTCASASTPRSTSRTTCASSRRSIALDNLVLGSTPDAYAMQPAQSGAPSPGTVSGAESPAYQRRLQPVRAARRLLDDAGPADGGRQQLQNSINVKRVWGEYMTPVGQLRFGRMPSHWGLGMLAERGRRHRLRLPVERSTASCSSPASSRSTSTSAARGTSSRPGPTNATPYDVYGGQPYNTCNLCNVNEWAAFVAHRTNPELQRLELARGDLVVNGGVYTSLRTQYLDVASPSSTRRWTIHQTPQRQHGLDAEQRPRARARRGRSSPDVWVQILWQASSASRPKASTIHGEIGASLPPSAQLEQHGRRPPVRARHADRVPRGRGQAPPAVRLRLGERRPVGAKPRSASRGSSRPQESQRAAGPISTFRFHPDYRVDLIFFRNILSRVEGAYYFRPSVDYDFLRDPNGQKFGGGAAVIWSRASEFIQTPGHQPRPRRRARPPALLPVEGRLAQRRPDKMGGFYHDAPVRRLLPARRASTTCPATLPNGARRRGPLRRPRRCAGSRRRSYSDAASSPLLPSDRAARRARHDRVRAPQRPRRRRALRRDSDRVRGSQLDEATSTRRLRRERR